nr:hypothetical protein GCM10025732_48090 [Glycomyces mayteni]
MSYVVCCKPPTAPESRGPGGLTLDEASDAAEEASRETGLTYRVRDESTGRRVLEFWCGALVLAPTEDETEKEGQ